MILLIHDNKKIVSIKNIETGLVIDINQSSIVRTLFSLSEKYNDFIIWSHKDHINHINYDKINDIFHHKMIMASFCETDFLPTEIGYANENSPFIKVIKNVTYPTWLMSSSIGGIHLEVIKKLDLRMFKNDEFNYFLNSLAYLGMNTNSLFCYSEPQLLINKTDIESKGATKKTLFKFVYQHQRSRWISVLLLNYILYEQKFPILSYVSSIFNKKRMLRDGIFESIEVRSHLKVVESKEIDVIIPTIGRKVYLYDVLKDLSNQTILPKRVIIVEQNPLPSSTSELDYLKEEQWPFEIDHTFIHKAGACNARNIALSKVSSEWVFFADDDIRFETHFFDTIFDTIKQIGCNIVTLSCLQKNEQKILFRILQWHTFGTACSFVNSKFLRGVNFDMRFEFGYREDADFGMKLRAKGLDNIYIPNPDIFHLKAPIGGFRSKPKLEWEHEIIQPKPSPTVMMYELLHKTECQFNAYKTILFIKYYKNQSIKNPFSYFRSMKKQWAISQKWAKFLMNKKIS